MTANLKKMYSTVLADHFPAKMEITFSEAGAKQTLVYEKVLWNIDGTAMGLRYGENPGQEAALYKPINGNLILGETQTLLPGNYLVSDMELLQSGKHPGKTNLTDADNALNILRYLMDKPTVVIVKHNNPCGVAQDNMLSCAFDKANMADRVAAFGGCIAANRAIDMPTAEAIAAQYAEVVVAPDFEDGVLALFAKKKNLRVLRIANMDNLANFAAAQVLDFKSLIDGGIIAQTSFVPEIRRAEDFMPATTVYKGETYSVKRQPTPKELEDLLFGWLVEAGVSSNSVLYVKDLVTVGIGTGEQDRVGVAEIARDKAYRKLADLYCFEAYGTAYNDMRDADKKAEIDAKVAAENGGLMGSCMVSDAFFPFRDGIEVGLNEGVSAVVQPGGSINDWQSIQACNEHDAAMVFTGQRSFKH